MTGFVLLRRGNAVVITSALDPDQAWVRQQIKEGMDDKVLKRADKFKDAL